MTFAEDHARLLLVLHTGLAVAAVAASTHLVLWLRKVIGGQHGRLRAVRRFAGIAAALHLAAFVVGNLIYPTYKVRVKVDYLQNPQAVIADGTERRHRAHQTEVRFVDRGAAPPTEGELDRATAALPGAADRIARWFDSKEHWVAMGLILALALAFLLPAWRPEPGQGGEVSSIVLLMAVGACLTLWMGAIVGVVTSSFRAVG